MGKLSLYTALGGLRPSAVSLFLSLVYVYVCSHVELLRDVQSEKMY